ncbi:MAG: hypothetical protein AB7G88_07545 [Thermomicrobiales bacterium]
MGTAAQDAFIAGDACTSRRGTLNAIVIEPEFAAAIGVRATLCQRIDAGIAATNETAPAAGRGLTLAATLLTSRAANVVTPQTAALALLAID